MDGKGNHWIRSVTEEVLLMRREDIMNDQNEKDASERRRDASLSKALSRKQVNEHLRQRTRRDNMDQFVFQTMSGSFYDQKMI